MRIEIITSPNNQLKETGFGAHLACDNVMQSIQQMGHSVSITSCSTHGELRAVVKRKPDLVVLAAKYMLIKGDSNIWFSEYFEKNKITYSGSSRATLKYDSDKVLAKSHLEKIGIRTADFFTATPNQYKSESEFPFLFPFFLKPADAANGNGIDDLSFVNTFKEFESKVLSLFELYNAPILVEEYLSGSEFTVAIMESSSGEMTVSAIDVIAPESADGLRILGSIVKKLDTEEFKKIDINTIRKVKDLAVSAFYGLGARGFGRIDIKMDKDGQCFFMEANLLPGMNFGSSYFPKACEIADGISYDEVVRLMLNECLERVPNEKSLNKTLKADAESCAA